MHDSHEMLFKMRGEIYPGVSKKSNFLGCDEVIK